MAEDAGSRPRMSPEERAALVAAMEAAAQEAMAKGGRRGRPLARGKQDFPVGLTDDGTPRRPAD